MSSRRLRADEFARRLSRGGLLVLDCRDVRDVDQGHRHRGKLDRLLMTLPRQPEST